MSNTPVKVPSFYPRATGAAQVLTGKPVKVLAGPQEMGPHTDRKNVYLGEATQWDSVDRFAAVLHECCHIIFPAKYPGGNLMQLANLIDDCRIERQFLHARPQYTEALQNLVVNVIANGKYDKPDEKGQYKDHWAAENFDPCLWALLFFRSHVPDDVRLAATDAIHAYNASKGYDKDPAFKTKFQQLVDSGLRITRLKNVSQATLQKWCELYFETFPEAKKDANGAIGIQILGDNQNGNDSADQEGEGDAEGDKAMGAKAKGGKGGQKPKTGDAGEAPQPKDLDAAVEALKARINKVGTEKERAAQESVGEESEEPSGGGDQGEGEDGEGGASKEQYDNLVHGGGPGRGDPLLAASLTRQTVNRSFVQRIKTSIRKLQTLMEGMAERDRKSGKLNMKAIVQADRKGIMPTKPFRKDTEDLVFRPVACCVATDFSGSTSGEMNTRLNEATHNMTFALESAGCECTEVVWNSGATITKTLDQTVSALAYKRHSSDGGTELMAACLGAIKSLKGAKAKRKVTFIFTDGAVNTSEIAPISAEFKKQGVEGVLLVSLGNSVPRSGIVETETITSIEQLGGVFERWVRRQVGRALTNSVG